MSVSAGVRSWVIGTAAECDVRVISGDPYVSGRHARVSVDDAGQVWVEDLGSLNGTWIQRRGVRMPQHPAMLPRIMGPKRMCPGDTLWLSRMTAIPWDVTEKPRTSW